jgi:peroxiredoxin/uncharacterized membrane protein YphA (DoxX/SURF4 family)
MDALLVVLRVVLAAVFVAAAVGKLLDREGSRQALRDFGIGTQLAGPGAIALPLAELAVAVALLPEPTALAGALGALVLLAAFSVGIGRAMARGEAPQCHCFGQLHSEPAGAKALVRNLVLAAPAVFVIAAGPGPAPSAPALAAALVVLIGVALAAVLLQKRAVTKAQEEAARPAGLPVGAPAPPFALSRLDGGNAHLADLGFHERPVLLVFTHAQCGPCRDLMPSLRRWQRSLREDVTIALISQGGEEDVREEQGPEPLDNVLLEDGMGRGVYRAYGMRGTPSAVGVGPDGRIATVTAEGELVIEELLRQVVRRAAPAREPAHA